MKKKDLNRNQVVPAIIALAAIFIALLTVIFGDASVECQALGWLSFAYIMVGYRVLERHFFKLSNLTERAEIPAETIEKAYKTIDTLTDVLGQSDGQTPEEIRQELIDDGIDVDGALNRLEEFRRKLSGR